MESVRTKQAGSLKIIVQQDWKLSVKHPSKVIVKTAWQIMSRPTRMSIPESPSSN